VSDRLSVRPSQAGILSKQIKLIIGTEAFFRLSYTVLQQRSQPRGGTWTTSVARIPQPSRRFVVRINIDLYSIYDFNPVLISWGSDCTAQQRLHVPDGGDFLLALRRPSRDDPRLQRTIMRFGQWRTEFQVRNYIVSRAEPNFSLRRVHSRSVLFSSICQLWAVLYKKNRSQSKGYIAGHRQRTCTVKGSTSRWRPKVVVGGYWTVSDSANNVVHDVTADRSYYVTAQKSDPASAQYLQSINHFFINTWQNAYANTWEYTIRIKRNVSTSL